MRILITGASGLIGKELALQLLQEGHEVSALVRTPSKISFLPKAQVFAWSLSELPHAECIRGYDAIVHLAGENIADGRWTEARKRKISESRIKGTENLVSALAKLATKDRPRVLISASAIGYYGIQSGELSEQSECGKGFLSTLCKAWEERANFAQSLGIRVITLRTGIVLSDEGGALSKMGPFVLGDGGQWLSWIHLRDVIGFTREALQRPDLSGPFNLVAPLPVRQREFVGILSRVRGYPLTLKVPGSILRLALGEFSETVLGSQKVIPQKILESGYAFEFPELRPALENLFRNCNALDQRFFAEQFVGFPPQDIVRFFSQAENLEDLTPPWLNFRIVKTSSERLGEGSIIDYRLNIHRIPVKWKTLISDWRLPDSFTDEQLKGPYKKWHHVHRFYDVKGGTLLTDQVTYRVPFSWVGRFLLGSWIKREVKSIFEYRRQVISALEKSGGFK